MTRRPKPIPAMIPAPIAPSIFPAPPSSRSAWRAAAASASDPSGAGASCGVGAGPCDGGVAGAPDAAAASWASTSLRRSSWMSSAARR